ncbi:hypothetical protein H0H92_006222 [Tricholoma furcatifolium]|nr:hypothetical protein H0H92_006222 [Tricholoma furcatifolium]
MDPDGELTLNMVNVELPFPTNIKPTRELDLRLKEKLLREYKTYTPPFYHNGRWWTRCSAQIWNELQDFERVADIWLKVHDELVNEMGLKRDTNVC